MKKSEREDPTSAVLKGSERYPKFLGLDIIKFLRNVLEYVFFGY